MADIQFSSITNGAPTGPGYFDVIMKSVMAHIEIEYNQNRLNGTDYATVYLGALQMAMATAEKFVMAEQLTEAQIAAVLAETAIKQAQSTADLALKAAQTDNYAKQALNTVAATATEGSKKLLVERQTKGFDDDALQKLLKQALDSWSVAYSVSTSANAIPTAITVPTIDAIMAKAKTGLQVSNG